MPLFIILKKLVGHGCVENLGEKDKESLEENGLSPYRELTAGFLVQISSQNREANTVH